MRVVIDTNVIVSAMLSAGGAPDQVLQLVLQGALTPAIDSRILGEYDEVTARPRFAFDPVERRVLLGTLASLAEHVITRPLKLSLPDPDDLMFVEVAIVGAVDAIVTGNAAHFKPRAGRFEVPVLTPREIVDRLRR